MKERVRQLTRTAIVVTDIQKDFCEGGALAVEGGRGVAVAVADYISNIKRGPDSVYTVVATKDWHIDPGTHFSGSPDFVDSWPRHCEADTPGADFEPPLTDDDFDEIFYKGQTSASYSGFEGLSHKYAHGKTLHEYLQSENVTQVHVVGLAFDYCVAATARDAAKLGYKTFVLSGLTAAVSEDNMGETVEALENDGVAVL